ncbi:hypothetical protein [Streptomyces sp. NPDC005784]|uniref:hypothetical protein n=1 Tax=Streptomyces sp. NPDC005784 TaxID=3364731 RepID=UPI00368D9C9F
MDVLEDGQIRASDPRPLLAAMTAARDGDFGRAPEAGHGPVAELGAVFNRTNQTNQTMDRSSRSTPAWSGPHGADSPARALDERPAGGRAEVTRLSGSWRDIAEGSTRWRPGCRAGRGTSSW